MSWGRDRRRGLLALLASAPILGVLAGCATAPVRPVTEWLGVLPSDATLYLSLNVQRSGDLLVTALQNEGSATRDLVPVVRSTRRAWAAATLAEAEPARYSIVALGNYPSCLVGLRLGSSRQWKRVSMERATWYEWVKGDLAVSVPSGFVVLASGGDPRAAGGIADLLTRLQHPVAASVPTEIATDMDQADLVLYLPQLPGGIATRGVNLPLREVWLDGTRESGRWDVQGYCRALSERDAGLLVSVVKLALLGWLRSQGLPDVPARLRTVSVAAEGARVKMTGLSFADGEMVPVLRSLFAGRATEPAASTTSQPPG